MDLHVYNKTEQFVFDSFNKAGKTSQIKHIVQTVYWLKVLSPNADEVLLVAAIAHDIERAFHHKDVLKKKTSIGFTTGIEFYRPHEERGAEIIADFLKHQSVDDSFIEKVKKLVSRHEEGGNDDQNLLKDADSISFFETSVFPFIEKKLLEIGEERVRQKIYWMYNRITSEKAKQIAHPFYEKAISDLNRSYET